MEHFSIYDLHATMTEKNILTAFLGDFNHKTTTSLLTNFKKKMDFLETATGINKKVYKVMVECLENISRYKASAIIDKKVPSDSAIFLLTKQHEAYCIITGNYIKNELVPPLQIKIDKINNLDKSALQEYYRQTMASPRPYNSHGAGLGLIDIAIKTGAPLNYNFKETSENYSFFTLEATIKY